jgi:hypothetical protein
LKRLTVVVLKPAKGIAPSVTDGTKILHLSAATWTFDRHREIAVESGTGFSGYRDLNEVPTRRREAKWLRHGEASPGQG